MKIIVTGGLGFIGKNLAEFLRAQAPYCELHCIDWGDDFLARDLTLYDQVYRGCFSQSAALSALQGADAVVHLAATTTVQESIANPAASFENNVLKTQILLDAVRISAPHAHFVFASTGGAIIGEYPDAIHESVVPRPVSPYGATKLAVEGMLSAYTGSFGMRTSALRFSNVYGPNSGRKTSVVAKFCRGALEDGCLTIFGDGKQTRDYVYVSDICQAIWRTIKRQKNGVFQLGTGVETSILALTDIFHDLKACPNLRLDFRNALPGEVKHNVCDISHARAELGYEPAISLARGVNQTFDWFAAENQAPKHQEAS